MKLNRHQVEFETGDMERRENWITRPFRERRRHERLAFVHEPDACDDRATEMVRDGARRETVNVRRQVIGYE